MLAALMLLGGCRGDPAGQHAGAATTRATVAKSASNEATASAATTATAAARGGPSTSDRVELRAQAMGTAVLLIAYPTTTVDRAATHAALGRAKAEIDRLEQLMSSWRDDSEVGRINAAAGRAWVGVSDDTWQVIDKSLWISNRSGGVFDITFASMGKLWRFGDGQQPALPDPQAVARARRRVDYRRVERDSKRKAVRLARADTRISLGGIAKGYAVDRAVDVLRAAGLSAFFVQAGGDLYLAGRKPNGQPWRAGVRDPRGPTGSLFATMTVSDHAFSTAGDYERAFIKGGKRYHHIIDPRSGYPATASRSVTIWAADALTADAIDDAVFILGPTKGLRLVESIKGCGAVIVDADNRVHISERLRGRVRVLHPPSAGL